MGKQRCLPKDLLFVLSARAARRVAGQLQIQTDRKAFALWTLCQGGVESQTKSSAASTLNNNNKNPTKGSKTQKRESNASK